jgi:hypothetical protein
MEKVREGSNLKMYNAMVRIITDVGNISEGCEFKN